METQPYDSRFPDFDSTLGHHSLFYCLVMRVAASTRATVCVLFESCPLLRNATGCDSGAPIAEHAAPSDHIICCSCMFLGGCSATKCFKIARDEDLPSTVDQSPMRGLASQVFPCCSPFDHWVMECLTDPHLRMASLRQRSKSVMFLRSRKVKSMKPREVR